MRRNILYGLMMMTLVVLAVTSCEKKDQVSIEGRFNKTDRDYIILTRIEVDRPVFVDSVKIKGNGSFRMKIKASLPEFYQIGFRGNDFITVLAEPGERIKLEFRGNRVADDFTVTGSPGTGKIISLDSALAATKLRIDSLRTAYTDAVNMPGTKEKQDRINSEYVRTLKEQRLFNIGFILKNLKSLASIKAIYQRIDENTYVLYDSRDLQFLKLVSDTLSKYYPESKQVKSLKINFEKELNQTMMDKINDLSKQAPEIKLDPTLKDINGKRITLSSLKGKYVLLTFWSAASNDCLAENIDFKRYYSMYRNKGFEIYQVNLDTSEEVWRRAVSYDELPWISVREDDPTNPVTASMYNVRVLPANYLYDRSGNIIASNIHGKALQLRLIQLFGN